MVLLAAAALRLWALPDAPVGLHYDEAANVILTRQIADGGYRPIFIRAYTGKEVFFFYAAAPWIWMTGGTAWGLRLGAAMLGILTVAATFAATHALFASERHARTIALLAAAWMACAFPHVVLSRYGFRAISQPLLQALTIAALWRGLRTGKRRWLAAGGAFLGLTGYTYLAARLFPMPLAMAMIWMLARSPRNLRRQHLVRLGFVLLCAVAAFAPLGLYFLRNPDAFTTRITQVAAPTWRDALRGLWLCLQALVRPGAGDPYIRFNLPGKPLLDPISALLAGIGILTIVFARHKSAADSAARLFIIAVLATMILPSALAASEITPSNLRMVGLYPFLAILPALGAVRLLAWLTKTLARFTLPPATTLPGLFLGALLIAGGLTTAQTYRRWATSAALFYAADGEMTLAAAALDALDLSETTAYIASEHYRHPTVAALARHYPQAKWLTGGATLVLPIEGDAVYLIPRSQSAPAPWPDAITRAWTSTPRLDPAGKPALWLHRLTTVDIDTLRPSAPIADFAHVVQVYDVQLAAPCRVAETCPIQVTWEALAPYTALQPVVRLVHPRTGEWTRTTAFHYPPEQWATGDVVLDQFVIIPPPGTPPVDGYQISVGFFNPDDGEVLPRLSGERFAGLDVRSPSAFALLPMAAPSSQDKAASACPNIPRRDIAVREGLRLIALAPLPDALRPGKAALLTLCWQATGSSIPDSDVALMLVGPETRILYAGAPGDGYEFSAWRQGEIVEDRYPLRLPKDLPAGRYALTLSVADAADVRLGEVDIQAVERRFTLPEVQHPLEASFGDRIRLRGYDLGTLQAGQPLEITLYWESMAEVDEDYAVFVHLVEEGSGRIVTQIDEEPQHGSYPTSMWVPGEIVVDAHTLSVPADLPAGTYRLRVGLYQQETGAYLAVNDSDSLTLPSINVSR